MDEPAGGPPDGGAPVPVDFFCIGAPKCATTWLAACLDEHPEISIGWPYEKRFLARDYGICYPEENARYLEDWEWYRGRFPAREPGQLRGDFTIVLYHNRESIGVLKEHYPNAKLIAMLRDPVARVLSAYGHLVRREPVYEGVPIEEVVAESDIVPRTMYHEHLRHWFDAFPRERIHVNLDLDLKRDPAALIRDTQAFLGVDPEFRPEALERRVNKYGRKRAAFRAVEAVARGARAVGLGAVMDAVNRVGVGPALRRLGTRATDYPEMPPALEAELRERFLPDVERLEKLLDRDLSLWKPGAGE